MNPRLLPRAASNARGRGRAAAGIIAATLGLNTPHPALAQPSAPVVAPPSASAAPVGPGQTTAPPLFQRPGPAGSLVLVEPSDVIPLVHVAVAVRSGSAWDPRKKDGLANLMGQVCRRGAAGKTREQIDALIDALGATLDVRSEPDSIRFEGQVLSRHLDAYLAIVADILLRPDFNANEVSRTRKEIVADIDELRTDDQALGRRFFIRNLYSDHPYGHPPEGDGVSLERIRREDLRTFHRQHVVGPNIIFAAAGDTTAQDFHNRVQRMFAALPANPAPGPNPLAVRDPVPPDGWRIQIVDKPDRQQAQILFGQFGVRAIDPDYVPLLVAVASFGGRGMKATLMDEVRTKRGLAYGTYMTFSERLGRGALTGWVFTANDKVVSTLKLVLRLYVTLMEKGIDQTRLAFAKAFLAGSFATEMDDPAHRLHGRISSVIVGLSPTFVDELPARIRALSAAEVNRALARNVRAHDLAITVVATADTLRPRLLEADVQSSAMDIVPYESY